MEEGGGRKGEEGTGVEKEGKEGKVWRKGGRAEVISAMHQTLSLPFACLALVSVTGSEAIGASLPLSPISLEGGRQ